MRRFDIAYVPNGTVVGYPAKPLQDMTLEEIEKKYLAMCAKSNGRVANCSKCSNPCTEGKRAIQLLANKVYNDPPIPLYGSNALIQKATEENIQRQKAKEESKMEETKKQRKEKQFIDGWWETSLASGNQLKWIMETFHMTKLQAQKKIYSYRYRKGLTNSKIKAEEISKPVEKETIPATVSDGIEAKMDALMKLQEKHKNIMLEMEQQYQKAKQAYEAISKKIDILCDAMDIMNE